jgi:hypothetical protein
MIPPVVVQAGVRLFLHVSPVDGVKSWQLGVVDVRG